MEGLLNVFAEGEWDLNFLSDDAGFMMHQLLNDEVGTGCSSISAAPAPWSNVENSTNLAEPDHNFLHPMGSFYTNSCHLSSYYGFNGQRDVDSSPVPYFWNSMTLELCQVQPDILGSAPNMQLNLKRKAEMALLQPGQDITSEIPKKKPRTTKHAPVNKGKGPSKKICETSSGTSDDETINNSSEGDSNAWHKLNAGSPSDPKLAALCNKHGNKKGQKGSAIDPQSLYARKRRERINERLQILQNLIPNGTKVDISTMLEEAVNYVKFLQTQIKLLSSDDMWMYAPIAYNGIDIVQM